ncbi:MAG: aspartyl/asparaginyl beta-hydroxylase domain-containing protein [Burkholderiaceae bacterium]|jgi:aspartate beta-hydroxylase
MNVLYDQAGALVRRVYDLRLSGPPVLDPRVYFPDAGRFIESWTQLRDEALKVASTLQNVPRFHEVLPSQEDISANDGHDWRILIVKAYGASIARNRNLCPHLAALLDACPDVLSASLSFLDPHKHIPAHRGPFRGIIRFHLGLSVPRAADGRAAAILTIDGVDYRIGDGESLLWDDTYRHEVLNDSDQMRVALLLDVRRRNMPWDMALLSKMVIGLVRASVMLRR